MSVHKFTSLFSEWFNNLDDKTKYSYYFGNCTVIDDLDDTFMRDCEMKIDEYILLVDETDNYRDHSLLYYIRQYVLRILNVPIPKKVGRKVSTTKKILKKIQEEEEETMINFED